MKRIARLKAKMGQCEAAVAHAHVALEAARELYRKALLSVSPRTAADYRIVVVSDNSWGWSTAEDMLADVQGDFSADGACGTEWREHYKSKKAWLAARAKIEAYNQIWINAWRRNNIACYSATLEELDPVTGEWLEGDSCGGFFSRDGLGDVEDRIREYLEPADIEGVEIIER